MKSRVLIIVTGDPRKSGRPAEAVRIAAGVGVWKKSDITVYLRGDAVRALAETEEDFADYWPLLVESGQPVRVEKNAAALREIGPPALPIQEITDAQLAKLCAEQTCVMRF
jgi:hypothetical protein